MHNVEWKIEGDKLIVTMDISQQSVAEAPPSASGKTYLVASCAKQAREVDDTCNQPYGQKVGGAVRRPSWRVSAFTTLT